MISHPEVKTLRVLWGLCGWGFLGAVPVILGSLAGWWGSIPFVPENRIFMWALVGLTSGLLVDVIFLKKWVKDVYTIPNLVWMGIYIFYSVGVFGFFMAVPVFNLCLAIPAGLLVGGKLAHEKPGGAEKKRFTSRTALFTTAVLVLACTASATIALLDPYTAANLQGMFGLTFSVTRLMLVGLIVVGGVGLLAVNWWVVTRVVNLTYQFLT